MILQGVIRKCALTAAGVFVAVVIATAFGIMATMVLDQVDKVRLEQSREREIVFCKINPNDCG